MTVKVNSNRTMLFKLAFPFSCCSSRNASIVFQGDADRPETVMNDNILCRTGEDILVINVVISI